MTPEARLEKIMKTLDEESFVEDDGGLQTVSAVRSRLSDDSAGLVCNGFVVMVNEGGYNSTSMPIMRFLSWVKKHHPEWWEDAKP